MNRKLEARESRSVRLRDDEWVLAEAIARINGENGAGHGLRWALAREAERLNRAGRGALLDSYRVQISSERTESAS